MNFVLFLNPLRFVVVVVVVYLNFFLTWSRMKINSARYCKTNFGGKIPKVSKTSTNGRIKAFIGEKNSVLNNRRKENEPMQVKGYELLWKA